MSSIVIPAHNEESVIARCLGSILEGADPGEFEIVVVTNGCTDRTAEIAAGFGPDVVVADSPIASKTAALNLGDQTVSRFPRCYVDADVLVSTDAVRKVVAALEANPDAIAAPRLRFALEDRPWTVSAFYDIWARMPYLSHNLVGSGFYALSAGARARFDTFPETFAEDFFIRDLVPTENRITVEDAEFVVHPPLSLRSLVSVRTRIFAANRRSRDLFTEAQDDLSGGHRRELLRLAAQPAVWPRLAVYLGVVGLAHAKARRLEARDEALTWDRDQTARLTGS